MGVEEFLKQEEERFIRDNLMTDEMFDFIRTNTLPFNQLMAYYRCAIMEVETKFKVLNEQFSLQYDRNPIESIKTRIKSTEGIIKKANKKKIPFTMLEDLQVKPIEALGSEFNPDFHNAVMHVDDDSQGENIIVEEFEKGYTYRDVVIRHSMVKVAN